MYAGMGLSVPVGMLTSPLLVGIPLWAGSAAAALMFDRFKWQQSRLRKPWSDCAPMTGAELAHTAADTPVRLRGRARLLATLPGILTPHRAGACQTLVVHEAVLRERRLFRERGCDFELRDASGVAVRIQVANARLLLRVPSKSPWSAALQPVAAKAQERVANHLRPVVRDGRPLALEHLRAWEYLLRDGDEVEIYGAAQHIVGPGPALSRQIPTVPAVAGSPERPMLIIPAGQQ